MEKYAYITVINDEKYLPGVLSLNEKLTKHCEYKLYVVISDDCSDDLKKIFDDLKINTIIKHNYCMDFENSNMSYWGKTLFKLRVFELDMFSKIVLIDGDMLVCGCLDPLFEKIDFSAVADEKTICNGENLVGFNSGLMVIDPAKHSLKKIIDFVNSVDRKIYGDQDILNAYYPNWGGEQELSNIYNIFGFRSEFAMDADNIKVAHFIGPIKPWEWSKLKFSFEIFKLWVRRKNISLNMLWEYRKSVMYWQKYINKYKKSRISS